MAAGRQDQRKEYTSVFDHMQNKGKVKSDHHSTPGTINKPNDPTSDVPMAQKFLTQSQKTTSLTSDSQIATVDNPDMQIQDRRPSPVDKPVQLVPQSSCDLGNLPKIPARATSNKGVGKHGSPPAIPPRPQPLKQAGIIQNQPAGGMVVQRQKSIISIPPQCSPQPPPKFVIPQLQAGTRPSLNRSMSTSSTVSSPVERRN